MENKSCKIHNEPAIHFEKDAKQNLVFYCRFCTQQRFKIQNMEDLKTEETQALKQLEMKFDHNIKQLKDFAEILDQFTQQIQQKLKIFKQLVEKNIQNIIEQKNQVKNICNEFTNLQLNQINEQKNIINNSLKQIILQLNNQIKELETITQLEKLYQSKEEICKLNQFDDIQKIKVNDKKFDFKLMPQSSYKQNERCSAIAFNKDATIMIVGCEKLIKVFEFQKDKLREVQQLSGHSDRVLSLHFTKKSNQFFSGSDDSSIIIWKLNQNNLWQYNQVLKGHEFSSWCIIMNQNEDILISGSGDYTIQFWLNQNNIWSCSQSIDCLSYVYSISLNDQEDQLIANVFYKQILVIQLQDKEWMIKQKIPVEQFGYRLCFINQNQFIFQPNAGQHLQIFDYDAKDQTYKKGQVLQYQIKETNDDCLFPIQYLYEIGLIIIKNGNHVHLVKKNLNGQFTVEQSINFNIHIVYGCICEDGRYIATWDRESKEIQIRKFEF